jgi:pSer/pThr/pTyr-binding forkhead associated (FHA) protein
MFYIILNGQRRPIDQEITYVGRDPACCQVVIPDDTEISRKHICLIDTGTKVILLDYKSSNGTLLNSVPVEQEVLKPGDQITIGRTIITVDVPQPPRIARHIMSAGYKTFLFTEDYSVSLRKSDELLRTARDRKAVEVVLPFIERIKTLTEPVEIAQQALDAAMTLSGSDRGFVMLVAEATRGLDMVVKVGLEPDYFLRRNLHAVLLEESLEHQRVVMTKDVFLERVFTRNTLVLPNVCSAIAVPVVYLGQPIGVFYTDRRIASGAYHENDLRNLVFAVYQASVYLGNVRLLVGSRGQEDMLQILEFALHGEGFVYCEVCGEKIERGRDSLVSCQKCDTLHHKDCWEYNNRCAIYGCLHAEARPVPVAG